MRINVASLVIHPLGKGEVVSSILPGSTSRNVDESATFSDFSRERSATGNPAKSGTIQQDPQTVTRWDAFRSAAQALRCSLFRRRHHRSHIVGLFDCECQCEKCGRLWTLN
jgi:hypothetical protein